MFEKKAPALTTLQQVEALLRFGVLKGRVKSGADEIEFEAMPGNVEMPDEIMQPLDPVDAALKRVIARQRQIEKIPEESDG